MNRHDQLVAKAYKCLYREGFHATGVERLAEQMGITKRTLYNRFGSKEGLLAEVLTYRHHDFMGQLEVTIGGVARAELPAAYLQFLETWTQSDHFYGCFFINICAEFGGVSQAMKQQAQQHKQAVRRRLADVLGTEQADLLFLVGEGRIVAAQTGQQFDKKLLAQLPRMLGT